MDGVSFTAEPARSSRCSGPERCGQDHHGRDARGLQAPDTGAVRVLGLDPLRRQAEVARARRRHAPRGRCPPRHPSAGGAAALRRLLRPSGRPGRAAGAGRPRPSPPIHVAPALRRRAASPGARPGAGGATRRWCSWTSPPRASTSRAGASCARSSPSCGTTGCCVLLATHELDEAQRLADRVVIVDHGRRGGRRPAGRAAPRPDRPEIRFAAPPGLDVMEMAGFAGLHRAPRLEPGEYLASVEPAPGTVAALTAWLAERDMPLGDLRAGRQRLEDVFDRLTRGTAAMRPLFAQARIELVLTLRRGESVLLTLGIPVLLLVFFSLVDVLPIDGRARRLPRPGVIALAVLSTAMVSVGHHHRIRAPVPGAEAAGRHPAGAPAPAGRQDPRRPGRRGAPGHRARRGRACPGLGPRAPSPSCSWPRSCWARWPSAGSGC